MIQNESKVKIVDNTGGKTWKVIRVLKGHLWKSATVGDVVVIAVKSATPSGQIEKWQVVRAVVVRVTKEVKRTDGSYIRAEDNAVAIVDEEGNPKGKRIFGPVFRELREKGFKPVANLADDVI